MFFYCDDEKFEALTKTNIITIKIYYYLINKCKETGLNKITFSYRELQDIIGVGHTSIARSVKTLKELGLINKVGLNKGLPEYELPKFTSGLVNFNFIY